MPSPFSQQQKASFQLSTSRTMLNSTIKFIMLGSAPLKSSGQKSNNGIFPTLAKKKKKEKRKIAWVFLSYFFWFFFKHQQLRLICWVEMCVHMYQILTGRGGNGLWWTPGSRRVLFINIRSESMIYITSIEYSEKTSKMDVPTFV